MKISRKSLTKSVKTLFKSKQEKMSQSEDGALELSSSSSAGLEDATGQVGSDSSEAELLLINEEDKDVSLRFRRDPLETTAETSDASHIAVQQIAKTSLTTKASAIDDARKTSGVEEFIPRRRTSMLTNEEGSFFLSGRRSKKKKSNCKLNSVHKKVTMIKPTRESGRTDKASPRASNTEAGHLDIVSAEVLEENERGKRIIVISVLAVVGTVTIIAGGLMLKRAFSK